MYTYIMWPPPEQALAGHRGRRPRVAVVGRLARLLPAAENLIPAPNSCRQAVLRYPVCFLCSLPPGEILKSRVGGDDLLGPHPRAGSRGARWS